MEAARRGVNTVELPKIHPELVLDTYKQRADLHAVWENSLAVVDNPEILYKPMRDIGIDDINRHDRSPWDIRVLYYVRHILSKKLGLSFLRNSNTAEVAALIADCALYPLNTLMKESEHTYSYHMLTRNRDYNHFCEMLARMLMGVDSVSAASHEVASAIQTHNIASFASLAWMMSGKKTYTVAKDLTTALRATKLNTYAADWLRSPAPAIYVEFPPKQFTFTTYADNITPSDTGYVTLDVEGAYILEDTSPQGMRLWRIVVICPYVGQPSRFVHVNHYYIPLYENKPIGDCVYDAVAMMKGEKVCEVSIPGNEIGKIGVLGGKHTSWDKRIISSAKDVFHFLMNIIIYVTREDADAILVNVSSEYSKYRSRMLEAKGNKRDSLKEHLKKLNSGTRILLGKNYTIKRWDEKTASQHADGGRHITVRTLVSGHWRNQAFGVGKLEHKTIWIEPFWRGPEAAPLTSKRATVK